jgi:hypothetical protein
MRVWLIVLLALMQMGVAAQAARAEPVADDRVPLIALIANPSLYDGRRVETSGYLNLEFEGDALYVGKDDFEAFATQNGVWFDGPKMADMNARRALDRHYVQASGIFHAGQKGHLGAWRGALEVEAVQISASRRQLSYLYEQPLSPVPLPWPPVIGLLAAFTALVYGADLMRRHRPANASGPHLAAHAFHNQPRAWVVLVLAVTLFMGLRVIGNAEVVCWTPRNDRFDPWFVFSVVEGVVGALGLIAMWAAHATRRRMLCALFIVLQLAAPTARELMRMNTGKASYPIRSRLAPATMAGLATSLPHPGRMKQPATSSWGETDPMPTPHRSHRMVLAACLGLSLAGCGASESSRVHTVRELVQARWEAPPVALGTLTVKADVRWSIEGAYVRDLACPDFCNNVLSLDLPGVPDSGRKPSQRQQTFDRALGRASKNAQPSQCMVLKVKPHAFRSTNPNALGGRYRIGGLEFVDLVDGPCPLNPGDHPPGYLQQPR